MMAWMNDETLRQTLERPHVFWSRSPAGGLAQGRHVGRPPVRPRGATTTATATRCCSSSSRRARAPATPASDSCFFRRVRPESDVSRGDPAESADEFRALARRLHRRAGVARAAGRPHHAGRRLRPAVPRRRAGLPARVGRARRALEPLVVRRPPSRAPRSSARGPSRSPVGTRARRHPARPGDPRRRRGPARALPVAAARPTCRRCTAGSSATSATTSCARSSTCPTCPHDDQGYPDAVLSVIGELAAFDHWRQRVTLIANACIPPDADRRRARPGLRRGGRAGSTSWPPTAPARSTSRWSSRRDPTTSCPRCASTMGAERVPPARSRWPRSTSWPATSSRSCCRSASTFDLDADPFDVYRVLRQVNPSPYMYFVRHARGDAGGLARPSRWCSCSTAQVISRPIAGTRRRGRTDEEDRRLGAELQRAPEGDRRAHHARRPGPQRRRPGRASSAPSRSTR